jgi:hypothetical protein
MSKECLKCGQSNTGLAMFCIECGASLEGIKQEIVITDISMSFNSMVVFMVKWVIASIPAFIILFLIGGLVVGMLGGLSAIMGS